MLRLSVFILRGNYQVPCHIVNSFPDQHDIILYSVLPDELFKGTGIHVPSGD